MKYKYILTKEFLLKEYQDNKKSVRIIAKEVKCSHKTIHNYLEKYSIKIRTISEAKEGFKHSDKTKQKMSKSKQGEKHNNWKGGFPRCIDCGKKISRQAKRCVKCYFANQNGSNGSNWQGGKIKVKCDYCGKTIEIAKHQLKSYTHHFCNRKCAGKYHSISILGKNNSMFGKKDKLAGNYIHGKGYEPYSSEFNDKLKNQIRKRDDYKCQNCGMIQEEHFIVYGRDIEVHHIDYNKQNCSEENLITLCKQCNIRANYNREYWEKIYKEKMGAYRE